MNTAFGRNVRAMREHQNMTQSQLADALGVTATTVWRWDNGLSNAPKQQEVIDGLKHVFNVSETDLFGFQDGYYAKLHGLTDRPKGAMAPAEAKPAYAPLLGRVHAGTAIEPDIIESKIPIPHPILERHPSGYFLEVEGTCMNNIYTEESLVFVDPDREPQDGSIAVVSIYGADHIMRRLKRGAKTLILSPDSTDEQWDDIIIKGDEHTVAFVGTVVWHQSRKELD